MTFDRATEQWGSNCQLSLRESKLSEVTFVVSRYGHVRHGPRLFLFS